MMKYLSRIALAGLVALAGCSGDSPSPSNPTPPGGTPESWAITALTASDLNPYVGTAVEVTATVTKDGNPAPDGTTVEFTVVGSTEPAQQVATEGGQASTGFGSSVAGTFVIKARVNTVSRTVSITVVERAESDVFQILPPLMPNHGAYDGLEQVQIRGKAVSSPVEVDFIVAGTTYPAEVVSVEESVPIESDGSITIRTPVITDIDRTISSEATVVVRVAVGTGNDQTAQLPAGFTYLAEAALWILQPLSPNTGSYEGSENITLNGRGIAAPAEVVFTLGGQDFAGVVQEVVESDPSSSEGSIIVATPYIPEDLRPSAVHENGYTYFLAEAVDVTVTTRVNHADSQTMMVPKAFTYLPDDTPPPEPDPELWIYQPFEPNFGFYDGGEDITLTGRAVEAPVEVVFTLDGQDFQGIVQQVVDSDPLTADGTIVVQTPFIPVALRPTEVIDGRTVVIPAVVDVSVKARVGFQDERQTTVPSAFTFIPPDDQGPTEPYWILKEPFFYLVLPDHGASAGGETVTILGRNFRAEYIDVDQVTVLDTAPAVETVTFGGIEGIVQSVSPDGTQVTIMTPRYSTTPLEADTPVEVVVTTFFDVPADQEPIADLGPFTVSRDAAYVFLADEPTPVITGIAPISGPVDGGTRVTIFGSGFQVPAQVTFGGLEAIGVEVNDDQTLADQDTIVCVTPDYSQQGAEPPVAVDVIVRNVLSGKVSDAGTYTYGDNLYISDNTPDEGWPGTNIIIYGSGFEDPLTVDFSCDTGCGAIGGLRLEVLSVSGTEILVRVPVDTPVVCAPLTAGFKVTLLESGRQAIGGAFTYLGNTPQIFGVDPIFVQETGGGDGVTPDEIVIKGDFFSDDLIVEIEGFRIQNSNIDVEDENTINVRQIPAPNDFDLAWDYSPCVTDTGLTGIRRTPTPVDITVINLPGNCIDTLAGGLVYEPQDDICEVAPQISVDPPQFLDDTPAGSCSAGVAMVVSNLGAGTLDVQLVTLLGRFYFDDLATDQQAGAFTVPPYGIDNHLLVYFCPDVDNGATYQGEAIFVSNDASSPTSYNLFASELQEPIIQTAPFGDGDTWTFPTTAALSCSAIQALTISNSGDAPLQLLGPVATAPFGIATPAMTPIPPGSSTVIELQFCPTADDGALQTGTLTIPSNDLVNNPVVINLEGQEQP